MVLNNIRKKAFSSLSPAFSMKKLSPERGVEIYKTNNRNRSWSFAAFLMAPTNKNMSRPVEIGGSDRVRTNASSQLGTAIGESRNPCTANNRVKYIIFKWKKQSKAIKYLRQLCLKNQIKCVEK